MYPDREWIYHHHEPLTRYSLGQKGTKPLVCFGVNPSTAKPGNLDPTVASVARYAIAQGYDGWLMFNLYPQRATNPDKMHKRFQLKIHKENLRVMEELLSQYDEPVDVWCAWGTLIEKRPYLSRCMRDIGELLLKHNCRCFTRGKKSKAGHPHHPLYLKKESPMDVFDLKGYLEGV